MSDIIQEVSVEAPVEETEPEAPVEQPPATLMPKAKGRPRGAKDGSIRKRRPQIKAPPPSEESSSDDATPLIQPLDMRSRKQRTYDSWFD